MTDSHSKHPEHPEKSAASDFQQQAEEPAVGIVREFWDFLCENRKWWLIPLLLMLLVFGVLVVLAGTPLAPFIYALY